MVLEVLVVMTLGLATYGALISDIWLASTQWLLASIWLLILAVYVKGS